jgi:hypothetical protein
MDNSLLHSYANLSNIKLPLKKNISINNFPILKKIVLPKLFLEKRKSNNKISNKYLHDRKSFEKNIFQSTFILKNKISNSNNDSKSNKKTSSTNESKNNHFSYIESSNNFPKKKSSYFKNNENNFSQKKKNEEKWKIQNKLSKILNKSKSIQPKYKSFSEAENNQKGIFNKLEIDNNYKNHLTKGKNIIIENDEYNSKKEIEILKGKVNYLIKKNIILENTKNENNQRIDNLEKKIDKLINYIKINEISNLKNKINSLENNVNQLKTENEKLKKEIHKKNKIFLDLDFTLDKINRSIGKKKKNSGIDNEKGPIFYDSKIKSNLNDSDIQRIKLISIDPDNL